MRKIYIAGPMTGIPEFNYPAFNAAARLYRELGYEVFNPAEKDSEVHGVDISKGNATGNVAQAAAEHGFSLRRALEDDLVWIARHATDIHMLPGWENSKGANTEWSLAKALGLTFHYGG